MTRKVNVPRLVYICFQTSLWRNSHINLFQLGMQFPVAVRFLLAGDIFVVQHADHLPDQIGVLELGKAHGGEAELRESQSFRLVFLDIRLVVNHERANIPVVQSPGI